MAGRREDKRPTPKRVRKVLLLDAEQLRQLREFLDVKDDAEVVRIALDHLMEHAPHSTTEEE